jgi:hypothetical protein
MDILVSSPTADVMVGADGVVAGVNDDEATLGALVPISFKERMRTVYADPFVNPVMVNGLITDAGDRVIQEVPLSKEYSMFEVVPPLAAPRVNVTVAL